MLLYWRVGQRLNRDVLYNQLSQYGLLSYSGKQAVLGKLTTNAGVRSEVARADLIQIIVSGVPQAHARAPTVWADIGGGEGDFTLVPAAFLAPSSTVCAVDRDEAALESLRQVARHEPVWCHVEVVHANFRGRLDLPLLDGALVANSSRSHLDHAGVLSHVLDYYLRPDGILLVVGYGVSVPRLWIPYRYHSGVLPRSPRSGISPRHKSSALSVRSGRRMA